MPPFKDWELRNRPPMWQPPPEDEPLMSIKGLYQDNARLIIHTYLFTSHRNKLAYIPVIYMCICVHVFGLSITITGLITLSQGGWAFPVFSQFSRQLPGSGHKCKGSLGPSTRAPGPPLVGGHFGHKTRPNVKTLVNCELGTFLWAGFALGWKLKWVRVALGPCVCSLLCFGLCILCVRLVICFDLLTWERRSRHVTAKFTLNYRSSLRKWFAGFAKAKHSEWG